MMYKVKNGYNVRQIAGTWVAVTDGKNPAGTSDIVVLSDTGVFLWNLVLDGISLQDMVEKATEEYEIDATVAQKDIEKFLAELKAGNLLEE